MIKRVWIVTAILANLFVVPALADGLSPPNPDGPQLRWPDLSQAHYFAMYKNLGGSQSFIDRNLHISDSNPVRRPRLINELNDQIDVLVKTLKESPHQILVPPVNVQNFQLVNNGTAFGVPLLSEASYRVENGAPSLEFVLGYASPLTSGAYMTDEYSRGAACCGPDIPRNDFLREHFGARNWRRVTIPMSDLTHLETLFDLKKDTFRMYASQSCVPMGIVRSVRGNQIFCLVDQIIFYYNDPLEEGLKPILFGHWLEGEFDTYWLYN